MWTERDLTFRTPFYEIGSVWEVSVVADEETGLYFVLKVIKWLRFSGIPVSERRMNVIAFS